MIDIISLFLFFDIGSFTAAPFNVHSLLHITVDVMSICLKSWWCMLVSIKSLFYMLKVIKYCGQSFIVTDKTLGRCSSSYGPKRREGNWIGRLFWLHSPLHPFNMSVKKGHWQRSLKPFWERNIRTFWWTWYIKL